MSQDPSDTADTAPDIDREMVRELGRILFRSDMEEKLDAEATKALWESKKPQYARRARQVLKRMESRGMKVVRTS